MKKYILLISSIIVVVITIIINTNKDDSSEDVLASIDCETSIKTVEEYTETYAGESNYYNIK